MIQLKNPKTEKYNKFKTFVLSKNFPWFYYESSVKGKPNPFFSHGFLIRPNDYLHTGGKKYPITNSVYVDHMEEVFQEIADFNGIEVNCIYRMNANVTEPLKNVERSSIHCDHPFPHNNMLIYLTDTDGATVCGDDVHNPQEDDIITFDGKNHFHYYPREKRRVVLVVTYV
jgi:hypothetical protein